MKHSTEFEEIIKFDSLYQSHRQARIGKRWKSEVIDWEMNLSANTWALHFDLAYQRYAISGYNNFVIYDPKERQIQAISYRDRIVQHSLCDFYLTPLLDNRLYYYNVACRKNKGTALAIKAIRKFLCEHYKIHGKQGYFIKIDIAKYFDSIDHKLLKEKLSKLSMPWDIEGLVNGIIDSYCTKEGKGLPMGNQSSQNFALFYLDCVDRLIKERLQIKHYVRYMDDMILIVEDKDRARRAMERIKEEIHNNKLEINSKSQIVAIKNGIEFLGYRFTLTDEGKIVQKLRRSTKLRIKKKIKKKVYLQRRNAISRDCLRASYVSYKGFVGKTNCRLLQWIKEQMKIK